MKRLIRKLAEHFGRASDDVAEQTARTSDEVAEAAVDSSGALNRTMTWGTYMGTRAIAPAALVTFGVIEVESGGRVTSAMLRTAANEVIDAVENGEVTFEELDGAIEGVDYINRVLNFLNKSAQNAYVSGMMGFTDPEDATDEQISRGRVAAASWLLMPDQITSLMVKNGIRMAVVDKYFEDEAEGNIYLAQEFLNDIEERTRVACLGDSQITREEIAEAIARRLQDQDTNDYIPDRLKDGLRQLHPEIFAEPDQNTELQAGNSPTATDNLPAAASVGVLASNAWNNLTDDPLTNGYNTVSAAVEDESLKLGMVDNFLFDIYSGLTSLFNTVNFGGWADGLISKFKGLALSVAGDDYVSQFGDTFGMAQLAPSLTQGGPAPAPAGGT